MQRLDVLSRLRRNGPGFLGRGRRRHRHRLPRPVQAHHGGRLRPQSRLLFTSTNHSSRTLSASDL